MLGEGYACIRIIGRANFTASVDFKALLDELETKGCKCYVLDLSECLLMDSTFLGVLAGLGVKLGSGKGDEERRCVELFNPSPRIVELLETLGVLHLFKVARGSITPPVTTQTMEHTPAEPTKEQLSRACLEAHQTLMDLNPANAARFKDVAQFLAEAVKKPKAE